MAKAVNSKLTQQIEARKRFLKRVVKFAEGILIERGKMKERSVSSGNINVKWELLDFAGFYFFGDFGQTMFGGNSIKVAYRPNGKSEHFPSGRCNLLVSWQGSFDIDKDCKVEYFDEDPKWQFELLHVIRNRRAITRKMDAAKAKFAKRTKKRSEEMKNSEKLKSEAKRLGLPHLT